MGRKNRRHRKPGRTKRLKKKALDAFRQLHGVEPGCVRTELENGAVVYAP